MNVLRGKSHVVQGFFHAGGCRLPGSSALQAKGAGNAQLLPADFLRSSVGGQPLSFDVRRKMEAIFKADFSDVRVHVGPEASRIGAMAFTLGSQIYFAPGLYNPESSHGQQLLGHELTHVVQQRAGRVRNPFGSGVAVVQDPLLEAEADRMGTLAAVQRVAANQAVQCAKMMTTPLPAACRTPGNLSHAPTSAQAKPFTPPVVGPTGSSGVVQLGRYVDPLKKSNRARHRGHKSHRTRLSPDDDKGLILVKRRAFTAATINYLKVGKGEHRRHIIPSNLFVDCINNWINHWEEDDGQCREFLEAFQSSRALYDRLNNNVNNLIIGGGAANTAIGMMASSLRKEMRSVIKANTDGKPFKKFSRREFVDITDSVIGNLTKYGGFEKQTQKELYDPVIERIKEIGKSGDSNELNSYIEDLEYSSNFDWPFSGNEDLFPKWKKAYDLFYEIKSKPDTYTARAFRKVVDYYFSLQKPRVVVDVSGGVTFKTKRVRKINA